VVTAQRAAGESQHGAPTATAPTAGPHASVARSLSLAASGGTVPVVATPLGEAGGTADANASNSGAAAEAAVAGSTAEASRVGPAGVSVPALTLLRLRAAAAAAASAGMEGGGSGAGLPFASAAGLGWGEASSAPPVEGARASASAGAGECLSATAASATAASATIDAAATPVPAPVTQVTVLPSSDASCGGARGADGDERMGEVSSDKPAVDPEIRRKKVGARALCVALYVSCFMCRALCVALGDGSKTRVRVCPEL